MGQVVHIKNQIPGVQTAHRALELLHLVLYSPDAVGLSELSRRAGLNKATTYRLMQLLEEYGYIAREEGGRKYVPGAGLIGFAAVVFGRIDIARVVQPVANRLAELTGETTSVHVPQNRDRVCVGGVESTHEVRRAVSLGHVAPLLQGVTGRVLLAHMEYGQVQTVLAEATKNGENLEDVLRELAEIRSAGYCAKIEARDGGMVGALAVPVLRADGVAAAMTIAGPADRWNLGAIESAIPTVLRESRQLSIQLGYGQHLSSAATASRVRS